MNGSASASEPSQPNQAAGCEAFENILRTAAVLTNSYNTIFKRHGISAALYGILRALRDNDGDGLASQRIAQHLVSPVPDLTRLVDRLEKTGLAERRRVTQDRRVVNVRITPSGTQLLDQLERPLSQFYEHVMHGFSAEELSEITRLMNLIRSRAAPIASA